MNETSRRRRVPRAWLLLSLAVALCIGAGPAQAARAIGFGSPAPVIDGNGQDLIDFAAGIGADGCAIDRTDPRDDIAIADPKIDPCATLEDTDGNGVGDYYVNGKDLRRFVSAYDAVNNDLYILFRAEGVIGDIDGNGNPDNNLCTPPANFNDQVGIGSEDTYEARYDINCDGETDITVRVQGNAVTVTGASGTASYAFAGSDLEVAVLDIDLPVVYQAFAFSGAIRDGLGEDITPTTICGVASPSIDLTKSVLPAVICPGQNADFTLTVENTGNVDLTGVTVVDDLPAALSFVSTVSNTCGGPVNQAGNQITYGPFNLAAGASCTIVIRASRSAECQGEQTNNASVEGTFQSPCVNGGEAIVVSDKAAATVLCGNVTCSIEANDLNVCPGETVQICGPEGNFSYAWSNGQTTRCITVGAGTYSLVITDLASGCVSTNPCSVTIVESPRPNCVIEANDTEICPGETVQICGPEGNFSYAWSNGQTTRCITVGAGTYSLVITDLATGCVSNNPCSVTIVENPRPECSISAPDTQLCPGETVQICGPEGNFSYAWSNGQTTRCITVGAGTYSLVITDLATGCISNNPCSVTIVENPRPECSISAPQTSVCPGGTVQICGPEGNFSYAWSNGATARCITVGPGTYSLVITDLTTGCVSNNPCSVTIVENPRPECSISAPDTQVCPGETVQICGPEGNFSYAWSNGQTTRCITVGAGTYSLVITDLAGGCVSNNPCSVTIVENPRPECSISAPDTEICPGETVQICGPEGNFSYAWSNGQTTRCITVGAGTYSLVITDLATGCVSNNPCSVTIVENPRPNCVIEANDLNVCGEETVQICGPEGNFSYAWSNGQTTRCISVGAGTYSLVITDLTTGCVSNNPCSVTIVPDTPPCVDVTVNDQGPLCVGSTFDLCGTVRNCGDRPADLQVRYLALVRDFDDVPAGESRNYCFEDVVMPACTGDGVVFTVRAVATNDCGTTPEDTATDTVPCATPLIDVEKVAQESEVPNGGTIHYTITVRNPSASVALENVRVVDDLCAYAVWTGVSNPAPFSAPAVGSAGGNVEWRFASLAPGAQEVITFEVTADVAAGGGLCPTTVQCQNDVFATGDCVGSNGQSTVRDDDSTVTPIICAGENCPRTVGFWGAQCAQKGNGSTKFTAAQMTQIAECVDNESEFFDWSAGTDFESFCRILNPGHPMQQRKQAKRQFAGVLANLCTTALDLQPSQGGEISLDPSTPIHCGGLEADTIGELIDEVDDILAELEGQDLTDEAVKSRYAQLISCLDGINNGRNIPTSGDCEHGTTTPTSQGEAVGSIEAAEGLALLNRAVPNPFTGRMSYAYEIVGGDQPVDIGVYNVAGRLVKSLTRSSMPAGRHTATWNGTDEAGARVPGGVYFVRVRLGADTQQHRVIFLGK